MGFANQSELMHKNDVCSSLTPLLQLREYARPRIGIARHALLASNYRYNNFSGLHRVLWRLCHNSWLCVTTSSTSLVPGLRLGEPKDVIELYVGANVSHPTNEWVSRAMREGWDVCALEIAKRCSALFCYRGLWVSYDIPKTQVIVELINYFRSSVRVHKAQSNYVYS